jgi:hypothetical protein
MTDHASSNPPWPPTYRKFRGTVRPADPDEQVFTVVPAYAGMPIGLYYALLGTACAVVLAVIIPINIAHPSPGARYGVLIAGLVVLAITGSVLASLLKPGALAATPTGIEFTRFNVQLTRPTGDPAMVIPWVNVVAERPGRLDIVGDGSLHLGRSGRGFSEAAMAHGAEAGDRRATDDV